MADSNEESSVESTAFRHVHPHGAVCYDFWCAFGEANQQPESVSRGIEYGRVAYAITNGSLIGYPRPHLPSPAADADADAPDPNPAATPDA